MFPLISVITTSYNQGKFIEFTIKSVIDQSYQNIEYVIIDGASEDETISVLQKYKYHPRIKKIISEKDQGQTDALIKGFNIASGDILCWLNSDDMFIPGSLDKIAEIFSHNSEIDVIVGNLVVVDREGIEVGMWPRRKMSNLDWLSLPQAIGQPATFFTRRAYDLVGGLDPQFEYSMDYDLFMKFGLYGLKFYYINDVLSYFRVHDESKTMALPHKQWRDEFKVFRKNGGSLFSKFYYWKIRGILSTIIKSKILKNIKW